MARTWLSLEVELLGGRGLDLWPRPGRVFAVSPSHTFDHLAEAINTAFARWDRAHLSQFTLSDGTVISDNVEELDNVASGFGPIVRVMDLADAKVARTVRLGETFKFVFDLGDAWTHVCTVGTSKVDPIEVLGIRPKTPLPYWGGGDIPDQYGRRWMDDDGEARAPNQPKTHHPMRDWGWPFTKKLPSIDLNRMREAVAAGNVDAFLDTLIGRDVDAHLTDVLSGAELLLQSNSDFAEAVAVSLVSRLHIRDHEGDSEAASELLTNIRARQ